MLRFTPSVRAASSFYHPLVSFIGSGALTLALPKIKSLCFRHPFIVTDPGLMETGLVEKAINLFKENNTGMEKFTIFSEVCANPTTANVSAGLALLNQNQCDSVISIGGGSPQDCAKAIALVKTNGGRIHDYEGLDKATKSQWPLIAINTTAGTASEMTRFAVITDEIRHIKMVITTDMTTPLIAINDSDFMMAQPSGLTAATGMDALTHAVEAYVSQFATPITDCCALQAIRLIHTHLPNAVQNGATHRIAREAMSYAEFLAGMAFNSAGLGYVHAMAHQMGGVYDLPHGVCNAILLPHVQAFNAQTEMAAGRLRDVAEAMGVSTRGMKDKEAAQAAVEAIQRLSKEVGIPKGFAVLGAKEEDLPRLADAALKDICAVFNPRVGSKEEIIQIYKNAM